MLFICMVGGDGVLAVTVFWGFRKTMTVQATARVTIRMTSSRGHRREVLTVEWFGQELSL